MSDSKIFKNIFLCVCVSVSLSLCVSVSLSLCLSVSFLLSLSPLSFLLLLFLFLGRFNSNLPPMYGLRKLWFLKRWRILELDAA